MLGTGGHERIARDALHREGTFRFHALVGHGLTDDADVHGGRGSELLVRAARKEDRQ